MELFSDDYFMREAMKEAMKAFERDEVPVGAVVVSGKKIIARAHNQVEILHDSTAHAEILAITSASNYLGNKYLNDCTLYVSLEPCLMCASALYWSRVGKLVYAAPDEKHGFMRIGSRVLHPSTKIAYGPLEEESIHLMQKFFRLKRK